MHEFKFAGYITIGTARNVGGGNDDISASLPAL